MSDYTRKIKAEPPVEPMWEAGAAVGSEGGDGADGIQVNHDRAYERDGLPDLLDDRFDNPQGWLFSVDGVDNVNSNVDFIAGAGMTITPDNVAKTITFVAANPAARAIQSLVFSVPSVRNGVFNILGWHEQTDAAAALSSVSSVTPAVPGYHGHFVTDISSAVGLPFTIRYTGTSVDESTGVLSPGDTEDIAVAANGYYQTVKSWVTAPVISIVEATKSCVIDVYRTSYWDKGNNDFTVDGSRFEWTPSSATWSATLKIQQVVDSGELVDIDNISFSNADSPVRAGNTLRGKYKRGDYSSIINGADKEGLVISIDQLNLLTFFLELKYNL